MTQAANVLNGGHNFNIINFVNSKTKNNNVSKFNLKLVRNDIDDVELNSKNSIVTWFERSAFVTDINVTVLPESRLFYKERVVLKFRLSEKYNSFFVLLKGLFGFRKPKGVSITSNRSDKSFTVELSSNNENESIAYFETIFKWLSKEARFKEVLKEVIRFEQKVVLEQALLVSSLQNSAR